MVKITFLAEHPEAIPTLAGWSQSEWGYLYPGRSQEDVEAAITQRLNTDRVPFTLVAHDEDELLGSVSLVENDMETHPHLSPWIASLYVREEHRGQGIGKQLLKATEERARAIGIKTLYLFTPKSEDFYRGLAWAHHECVIYRGHPATIMSKHIGNQR
ncbi:MAG: GNAT family N-acetyltransferase [Gammaproteobacteria bacterium]|nr:GNAT family N-acetyltransferase [Gammaproteobacteria bacterium]